MCYKDFFMKSAELYQWLEDELSRDIFRLRFCYSGTGDYSYITKLSDYASSGVKSYIEYVKSRVNDDKIDYIVIYGAGKIGKECYLTLPLPKEKVIFCDQKFTTIGTVLGHPVENPSDVVKNYGNAIYLNCGYNSAENVHNLLTEQGVLPENILLGVFDDVALQYFDEMIILKENELFVDVGAFDGLTTKRFLECCKEQNVKPSVPILYEPEKSGQEKIKTLFKKIPYIIHNVGAWNKKDVLLFTEGLGVGNCISQQGTYSINVDSIDQTILDKEVTYIKMDIEGAELLALQGAQETIKKYQPKLAVSIYHKPEDIIEIFDYVRTLLPNHKYYLRHYSSFDTETVLYAVPW